MPSKPVTLEVAAFLDSPEARELAEPRRADVQRIAEAFVAVCYEELGTKPRLLDGEGLASALAEGLPARLKPRDPLAEHVPAVLAAFLDHLEATQVVSQGFELRRALEEASPAFLELVRSGRNAARRSAAPERPFVHGASKLGRNDPCSCGSGRKYKHCHGKPG